MRVRLIVSTTIAAAVLGSFGNRLDAQSMSTLSNAKRVASNAVAATNEHTNKEQMVGDAPAAATKPASKAASATASGKSATPAKKAASKRDAAAPSSAPMKSPKAAPDSARFSAGPDEKGPEKAITLLRESFSYNVEGRRDPFVSLIENGDLRPMISDLRLVTVIFDPAGRSVAIMRDVSTQEQYRVKPGQTLGRMRVSRIAPKAVTFTIEEYGFSRQEVLALNDSTRARSQ